jgi:hypothetical protein
MRFATLPPLRPGFAVLAILVQTAAVLAGSKTEAALLIGLVCTVKLAVSLVLAVLAAHVVDASLPILGIRGAALKARFGDCSWGDLAFFVGAPAFHTFALAPTPAGDPFGGSYLSMVSAIGAAFAVVAFALYLAAQPAQRRLRPALGRTAAHRR